MTMSNVSTMLIQESTPYAVTASVEPPVNQYYAKGSTELATETPLTVERLEHVSLLRTIIFCCWFMSC
jgi:hypothetical protein